MTKIKPDIRLGLGLIGIGREWGFQKSPVPDEKQVLESGPIEWLQEKNSAV